MSDEKQESLNEVTNRWNKCKIKDTSLYPVIWFNDLYNLNLKLKNIKTDYKKHEDGIRTHVFNVLTEEYKPGKLS